MYSFLHKLLSDKKGGETFSLFSIWHFFYILLTLAIILLVLLRLKGKDKAAKVRTAQRFVHLAFAMYIADIFLMPLAYGEIDIEKLPFHACTAMCVMCFLSCHIKALEKYRSSFTLLGFVSNLVYLIYPAGVMWHAVHPLSYRVIQTLLFHSIMTVYGVLMLAYEQEKVGIKKSGRDLFVIVCMTLWAMLGNYTYNGTSDGYSHFFNWFFVVRDPFYAIDESVAPFVMPFLNVALFFVAELVIQLAVAALKKVKMIPQLSGPSKL